MEDMIKQIAQIDCVAVSNRRNSEKALQEKREAYERQMEVYREETIQKAHKKADKIYSQIVSNGESGHHLESEQCKQSALALKKHYLEIEEILLNEVFNELFGVEG